MKVPQQGSPEHHSNLACGRCHWLELGGWRIHNVGDVQAIAAQSWGGEAGDIVIVIAGGRAAILRSRSPSLFFSPFCLFALDNDRPSRREGGVVEVQVIGFEGHPAKDWRDRESLAIWKMANVVSHSDLSYRTGEDQGPRKGRAL